MRGRTSDPSLAPALRGGSPNRAVVLGEVRLAGRIGRAEIARRTGLSTQGVSNIIAGLIDAGLLLEKGRRVAGRGQPAAQYGLNPGGAHALGFELRPDAALAALIDLEGTVMATARRSLEGGDRTESTAAVLALKAAVLDETGIAPERLAGAGLVLPGPFGTVGPRLQRSELRGWHETDPAAWFAERLDLPVIVENDANAAALAERVAGQAAGLTDYAFLYFGAGLGLGLVERGRLLSGAFGNAGEIGQIPVTTPSGPCPLEDRVSRLSLQRHLDAAGLAAPRVADLDQLADAAHPALTAWIERAAPAFSQAIEIIENMLDPETILVGGAMPGRVLDGLMDAATLSPASVSNRAGRRHPRLMRGAAGTGVAARGAAALVIDRLFAPRPAALTP